MLLIGAKEISYRKSRKTGKAGKTQRAGEIQSQHVGSHGYVNHAGPRDTAKGGPVKKNSSPFLQLFSSTQFMQASVSKPGC